MLRTTFIAVALIVSTPVLAQDMTAEQRAACKGDYDKLCAGVFPGGGRIVACLAKQSAKLTPACKKVVDDAQRK